MHEEIKARKSIKELLSSAKEFEQLKGMVMLFTEKGRFYKYSGMVTAALLDYEDAEKQISIIAIKGQEGWITFEADRTMLIDMLENTEAVIGDSPEKSFLIINDMSGLM